LITARRTPIASKAEQYHLTVVVLRSIALALTFFLLVLIIGTILEIPFLAANDLLPILLATSAWFIVTGFLFSPHYIGGHTVVARLTLIALFFYFYALHKNGAVALSFLPLITLGVVAAYRDRFHRLFSFIFVAVAFSVYLLSGYDEAGGHALRFFAVSTVFILPLNTLWQSQDTNSETCRVATIEFLVGCLFLAVFVALMTDSMTRIPVFIATTALSVVIFALYRFSPSVTVKRLSASILVAVFLVLVSFNGQLPASLFGLWVMSFFLLLAPAEALILSIGGTIVLTQVYIPLWFDGSEYSAIFSRNLAVNLFLALGLFGLFSASSLHASSNAVAPRFKLAYFSIAVFSSSAALIAANWLYLRDLYQQDNFELITSWVISNAFLVLIISWLFTSVMSRQHRT